MEELFTWPGEVELLHDFGWLAEHLQVDDLERILAAGRNSVFCVYWIISELSLSLMDHFESALHRGNMPLLELIEHHRPRYQAILDEFFSE